MEDTRDPIKLSDSHKEFSEYKSEFHDFINFLPEGIYATDENGKITVANNAALEIFGFTIDDVFEINSICDLVVPEERDILIKNRDEIIRSRKSLKHEYHALKKDGSVIPVLIHTTPIIKEGKFSGTRGVIIDLTESKIYESGLIASNKFLNTTINAMQEPFFVKDENHKWVLLNDASVEMWGHSREELIGKSDYDIFPKEQADVFWEKDDYVFKNGSNKNIEEITNSKGQVRTIITSKVRYTDKVTEKKYIVGTIHDITELRQAEIKLKHYSQELEELNNSKDKFFSIIAHDLRNPFTSIFGFSSVLQEDFDTLSKEEIREYVNYIFLGTKNIYDLIENLLAWSRLQTGRISVQPVKIDVYGKIQDTIEVLNVMAIKKRIKIFNLADKNTYVMGDDNMVSSIFQNLISNAIKFTNPGGSVKISSTILENEIEISICDSGIGMTETELENLFLIGKQKSKAGTYEERGTGLGLILCKEMISKLNGRIAVESKPGDGSIFKLSLPGA